MVNNFLIEKVDFSFFFESVDELIVIGWLRVV